MKSKITKIIAALLLSLSLIPFCPALTFAAENTNICNTDVAPDVKAAAGCEGTSIISAETVIVNILYSVILVLGVVAVIFIIKGGLDYMTSAGDSQKTQKAKSTIIYAVIGLVICVLSFAIVNFTINVINQGTSGGGEDSSKTTNTTTE